MRASLAHSRRGGGKIAVKLHIRLLHIPALRLVQVLANHESDRQSTLMAHAAGSSSQRAKSHKVGRKVINDNGQSPTMAAMSSFLRL